jgi:hypothetical protein
MVEEAVVVLISRNCGKRNSTQAGLNTRSTRKQCWVVGVGVVMGVAVVGRVGARATTVAVVGKEPKVDKLAGGEAVGGTRTHNCATDTENRAAQRPV